MSQPGPFQPSPFQSSQDPPSYPVSAPPIFPPPGSSPSAWSPPPGQGPLNPYASPQIDGGYSPNPPIGMGGVWRQGNLLVMHKLAPLPPLCVLSGEPATQWLKRKLAWHPPWIYLLILLHLLLYAVVALIMQKTATIQIGLTDEWMARRRTRMLIAWGVVLGGFGLGAAGVFLEANQPGDQGFLLLLLPAFIMALGGTIYGLIACRLVRPERITDQYIWLKGVHANFLDRLPQWPYGIL